MIRASLAQLRNSVPDLPAEPAAVQARLEEAGYKVDRVLSMREALDSLLAVRVEDVQPHPDADRLRICTVNVGAEAPIQVVCGAPNVEAGGSYALVPHGGYLPTGGKFKKTKLRGEVSEGMLCSARELEMATDAEGLLPLPTETPPGTPLGSVISAEGTVFEIEGKKSLEEIAEALRQKGEA